MPEPMKPRRTTAEEMVQLRRRRQQSLDDEKRATIIPLSDAEEIAGYLSVHPMVAVALNDMNDTEFYDLLHRARQLMKLREAMRARDAREEFLDRDRRLRESGDREAKGRGKVYGEKYGPFF